MTTLRDRLVGLIHKNAVSKAADLAGEYARAAPGEKEAILAGLDFEQWLAETCQECVS